MSTFISLSAVFLSTPDGKLLFNDFNMTFGSERTGVVGRNGVGKSTLLHMIAGDLLAASGRIQISGTVAMMRQDAVNASDDTIADLFGARSALDVIHRAEAGIAEAEELATVDWMLPARIEAALLRCGLSIDQDTPLLSLSGGQRSRAALAALIFAEPDFLLLDEPTNNLDRDGRRAVIDLIRDWKDGAIIVSHDRELLEEMDAIIELTSLGATRYGGNYSAFKQRKDAEQEAAERDLSYALRASKDAARNAQQAAERKARKDSAGQRARAKGDQPKILMDVAKGRAEASGGAGARLHDARREAAIDALSAARQKIEILNPLQMGVPKTGLQPGKTVLNMEGLTGGYDPDNPVIRSLSLTIIGSERIAIAGPNGSGKTTLLKLIVGEIKPQHGVVNILVPFALLDQHLGLLDPASSLHENFRRLNPSADANMAHTALAHFGFRASDALRKAADLSGGERLRAGLACTVGGTPPPMLLILDEPTNHLDLDGIAALEAALTAYDGAILVISHDETFLRSITPDRTISLKE